MVTNVLHQNWFRAFFPNLFTDSILTWIKKSKAVPRYSNLLCPHEHHSCAGITVLNISHCFSIVCTLTFPEMLYRSENIHILSKYPCVTLIYIHQVMRSSCRGKLLFEVLAVAFDWFLLAEWSKSYEKISFPSKALSARGLMYTTHFSQMCYFYLTTAALIKHTHQSAFLPHPK